MNYLVQNFEAFILMILIALKMVFRIINVNLIHQYLKKIIKKKLHNIC
jgi:hypothetical protein